jgi:hypothetical protein
MAKAKTPPASKKPRAEPIAKTKLRLKAADVEDLAVISAILQDALVAVGDLLFEPAQKRFVLVANRFRHESAAEEGGGSERVLTGLRVDGVTSVQRRGFNPREADRLMVLLAIRRSGDGIYLDFAGGTSIRLDAGDILCHLDDLGEPWPTRFRPHHPEADPG